MAESWWSIYETSPLPQGDRKQKLNTRWDDRTGRHGEHKSQSELTNWQRERGGLISWQKAEPEITDFLVNFGSLKAELPIILSPSQSFSTGCGWGDVRAGQSNSFFYGHGFIHEKMNNILLWLYSLYLAFPCEIFASDVDVGLSTHFWPHSVLLLALRKHNLCLFAFKLYNTSTAHICLNVRLQL